MYDRFDGRWMPRVGLRDAPHSDRSGILIQIKGRRGGSKHIAWTASSQEVSMRFLAIAALSLMPASAFAARDCRVTGLPAEFGIDMTAYFAVKSGETCNFPIRIPGMMNSSGVSQKPAHGTLRQLNVTTFRYSAASGYRGSDTFAIYGVGKGPYGSGRSVMTVNATIE